MKKTFFILAIFILTSCTNKISTKQEDKISIPSITLESSDTSLHFKNGFWFLNEKLFSGYVIERFTSNNIHQTTAYFNGKEEGQQLTYFEDNNLAEKRFYHHGEKDSTHKGWWPNGNKRFEYHFKDGAYNGDYKEWYETGELLKQIHYTNGNDDSGKGWRQNGKLYMNFVVKNGRRYGLNNSNLCYTVKNSKGEYVESEKEENTK